MRALRIAMIGQRSIPANYGGVERAVEELGARLAARGHHVTVFCLAADDPPPSHRGMELRRIKAVPGKHLRAFTQSVAATLAALRGDYDIVHFHAMGPSLPAPLLRLRRNVRIVSTVQGRDDKRAKWSGPAKFAIRTAARLMARVADRTIVVSDQLAQDYANEFRCITTHIPNGVMEPRRDHAADLLPALNLEARGYVLNVGRLVPEKAVDLLVEAYRSVDTVLPLVIVGGSASTDLFTANLNDSAQQDPRVLLLGERHDETLRQLFQNARCFVFPSRLEGLPIALLEAASFGLPIVSSDIPPAMEVLGSDIGPGIRTFADGDTSALAEALRAALAEPLAVAFEAAEQLRHRVLREYSWDIVTDLTEAVYGQVLGEAAQPRIEAQA